MQAQKKALDGKVAGVEQARSEEGPLGSFGSAVALPPCGVAGAVWRGFQQHVGVTKKDAEAAWKVEWNKEYKVKFEAFRKDNEAFKQQLDIDAMVWMEEVCGRQPNVLSALDHVAEIKIPLVGVGGSNFAE